jgi:hypothetical protein
MLITLGHQLELALFTRTVHQIHSLKISNTTITIRATCQAMEVWELIRLTQHINHKLSRRDLEVVYLLTIRMVKGLLLENIKWEAIMI